MMYEGQTKTTSDEVRRAFSIPDDGVPAKPKANDFLMHLGWLCGQNHLNVPKQTPKMWDGWNPLMLKYANYLHETRPLLNLMEIARDCLGIPERHLHWFKQAAETFREWEAQLLVGAESESKANELLEANR